ncbi:MULTISPECIES: Der GTPase-activating protein YihI [Serratia]|jgi:ribosome assembly protein YihI (activator of Der GTPase)|uniref:Der GTPase-activating protein YihI n=1 Tax=Serratia TaxID=613 RepID=UPI00217C8B97|nr:Der GTPase-activating protein YihI [Serratia liquefaciens]CAI1193052.1 Der GTPase-activating protein YihI [Serratia liquefaciens]CAI1217374.1 Der GTPase-activating protein YihI [Serratia liquefaciens]HDS5480063.1 Der GTPase-activating protein YihI [Serratia liquefaciens]HEJ7042827.1 Der GTPase-activating protein YihI [Serratia liquefaciens]
MNQPSKAPRAPRSSAATSKTKKKSRVELDQEARERKRLKKRRGLASGSRTQVESANQKNKADAQTKDPRIGSKVPVALVVEAKPKTKPQPKPKAEAKPRLSPEEELAKLENDERLDALLDRIDDGETLSAEDQSYVDQTLDRIDALMEQLGIELGDDEDDEEEEKKEDILKLLKGGNPKDVI